MQRVAAGQISLDACSTKRKGADLVVSNVSVSGKFSDVESLVFAAMNTPLEGGPNQQPQLDHGEKVTVTLSDADGEVFAAATGTVEIGFKDTEVEGSSVTIREQKIKL